MTLAQAAKRAIELGGIYDGHELPKDINAMTTRSATALAGQGLMGVAKDNYKRDGTTRSFAAAFAEVEVDIETGKYTITDFLSVADVGTVIHPSALGGQILGRSMLGIAHAIGHRWVYDQRYGVVLAKRFYNNGRRRSSTCRRTWPGTPSACPIRKRRSAREASANLRSRPPALRC